jgi:hypothetical protein
MTEPYDPDKVNQEMFGESRPAMNQGGVSLRESQPLSQNDAIILKDQADEFDRKPVDIAVYDAIIDKAEYGLDSKGKPKINFTWRITGPKYADRLIWLNLAPRSNEFSPIMLKKLLTRAQKADTKGEYHSLINEIDVNVPFDEKAFCDRGIAIGAEAKIKVTIGKPYTRKDGLVTTPNNIADIMYPAGGEKFMQ